MSQETITSPHISSAHALRSPEQYARIKHTTPYCYKLGDTAQLHYLGVHHSFDPDDTIFSTIRGAFHAKKPDVVFVEGLQGLHGAAGIERMATNSSYRDAVTRGGEAVFTIKEALSRNISWACPEPEDTDLYQELVFNYFSRDEIFAWYVISLLPQFNDRTEVMNFNGYAAPFIAQFKEATQWKDFDYSLERALAIAESITGHDLVLQNSEHAAEITDPIPWPHRWEQQTIFNEMSRVALQYRDMVISNTILNELTAGKNITVVYGAGHAVMQEPVYRGYFG